MSTWHESRHGFTAARVAGAAFAKLSIRRETAATSSKNSHNTQQHSPSIQSRYVCGSDVVRQDEAWDLHRGLAKESGVTTWPTGRLTAAHKAYRRRSASLTSRARYKAPTRAYCRCSALLLFPPVSSDAQQSRSVLALLKEDRETRNRNGTSATGEQ